ncbi:lysine transporter LysE [Zhengella mangrovi]|uniref:Lysine transporter LysE n=1 Tax=Zhengella mangrovi TaxID=1982044 RepID=A0A2G1QL95_9HYPH|nr:LysE family translocator [Zhengella mangrovi]PHP66244.1 lysine transporter LysE [Zhengella mangrovi]
MSLPVDLPVLAAFCAASMALLIIPGPTIIMVVAQALAHGRRVALASVAGVALGDFIAASLSLVGVGTILAASATAFTIVKWIGAAYLVWIGIKMWRSPVSPVLVGPAEPGGATARWPVFRDAFLVTLFNPKGIVFFLAFVPQFITPAHDFASQALVFVIVFTALGIVNAAAYAALAGTARQVIRRPRVLRAATRTGAGFLISAGLASLMVRRAV